MQHVLWNRSKVVLAQEDEVIVGSADGALVSLFGRRYFLFQKGAYDLFTSRVASARLAARTLAAVPVRRASARRPRSATRSRARMQRARALLFASQADVERRRFATPDLHVDQISDVAGFPNLDAVTSLREIDEQPVATLGHSP